MRQFFDYVAFDLVQKRLAGYVKGRQTRDGKILLKQANQLDAIATELRDEGNPLHIHFTREATRRRSIAFLSNTIRRRAIARGTYRGEQ